MRYTATPLKGLLVAETERKSDSRGYFSRWFCVQEAAQQELCAGIVQVNAAFNEFQGTLRGLHWQSPPFGEVKLVRCISGAIFDIAVDLRPESETYLQWYGLELSPENGLMLCIPKGFAHGYLTLRDDSEVLYFVSQFHEPSAEKGARWDDPAFGITWPDAGPLIISDKDRGHPPFGGL